MFWGQCNACEKRWPLGSPSECTCPQESNWQNLSDYEIWQCNATPPGSEVPFHISMAQQNVVEFARAIEAKLKEKNM